jgi:ubiquinol-cytochrome c reductase cytochrome c subunit
MAIKNKKFSRRSPFAAALVLIAGLVVSGGTYVAASAAVTNVAPKTEVDQALIDTGKKLFLANCASCHGKNAEGAQGGPSLIGVGSASVDFQVATGRMPGQASGPQMEVKPVQFKQEDIDALAAYVASLAPGPESPTEEYLARKGDAAKGGELFRINCAMCHNAVGAGGALTEGKYAPPLSNTEAKHVYQAMVTGPQNMPVFSNSNLSVEAKTDIITYLQYVQENPSVGGEELGNLGPVVEGLWVWLGMLGLIVLITIWLGAKSN